VNHPSGKYNIILQSGSQVAEFKVARKPDQGVKMKHASSVGFHHAKVV